MYRFLSLGSQVAVSGGNFTATLIISIQYGLDTLGIVVFYLLVANIAMSLQLNYFLTPVIVQFPKCKDPERYRFLKTVITEYSLLGLGLLTILILIVATLQSGQISKIAFVMTVALVVSDFMKKILIVCRYIVILALNDVIVYCCLLLLLWLEVDSTAHTVFWVYAIVFVPSCIVLTGFVFWMLRHLRLYALDNDRPDLMLQRARRRFGLDLLKSAILQVLSGNGLLFIAVTNLSQSAMGVLRLAQSLTAILNPFFVYAETFLKSELAEKADYKTPTRQVLRWYLRLYPFGACVYGLAIYVFYQYTAPEQVDSDFVAAVGGFLSLMYLIGISGFLRLQAQLQQDGVQIFKSYFVSSVIALPMIWPLSYFLGIYGVVLTLCCAQFSMILYFLWAARVA